MLLFGRLGVNMKLVVIIIYHGIYLVCATSHIDHILTSHIFRLSWKHFARWRDLRKNLHMKTDKELESVLCICAVQFHLVLSMKRYMTSCIVIWRDVICRHLKWRQRWATFRLWAGSAPGISVQTCSRYPVLHFLFVVVTTLVTWINVAMVCFPSWHKS